MSLYKADIMSQLRKEVVCLQGFKASLYSTQIDVGLGMIEHAFPNAHFPLGAIHEFICEGSETAAATTGFIAGVISSLMRTAGIVLWIGAKRKIFPPALKSFTIHPDRIIFIHLQKEQEILWAIEEALKCEHLAAVVGEIQTLSFIVSRRLQLAVEKSLVTGFLLCHHPYQNTTASVAKWRIRPDVSEKIDGLPGVGFPRWNVELLKARNGKPGCWQIEWVTNKFHPVANITVALPEQKKKVG